jgi:hypothetical protein
MIKGLDASIYGPRSIDERNPGDEVLLLSIALSLNRIAVESESIAQTLLAIGMNLESLIESLEE